MHYHHAKKYLAFSNTTRPSLVSLNHGGWNQNPLSVSGYHVLSIMWHGAKRGSNRDRGGKRSLEQKMLPRTHFTPADLIGRKIRRKATELRAALHTPIRTSASYPFDAIIVALWQLHVQACRPWPSHPFKMFPNGCCIWGLFARVRP